MKIVAIVPAAGRGARMNHSLSKQYLPLGGKPIIARTLLTLDGFALIDEIVVSVRKEEKEYCREKIIKQFGITKVHELVEGGQKRQDSVYNALKLVEKGCELVVIHDSVRPFITEDVLMEAVSEANIHEASVVAVPVTDTVKEGKEHGFVDKTLPRKNLWSVQTPQVFVCGLILEAHRRAREEGFTGTDDSSLVERMGHPVRIVEGTPNNIKITTPEDLIMAEAILRELGK